LAHSVEHHDRQRDRSRPYATLHNHHQKLDFEEKKGN
jgi:hypothetical protein